MEAPAVVVQEVKIRIILVVDICVVHIMLGFFWGMQNARLRGSWRFLLRYQRQAWEARQCGTKFRVPAGNPNGKIMHEILWVKPKLQ